MEEKKNQDMLNAKVEMSDQDFQHIAKQTEAEKSKMAALMKRIAKSAQKE